MPRLILALLAALAIALTACSSDEENVAVDTFPASSPTDSADAIIICPHIGVPGEATPATQTPPPSCKPGANFETIPGIRGEIAGSPALPSGKTALTRYYVFTVDHPDLAADISLPVSLPPTPTDNSLIQYLSPRWYTYESDAWHELDTTPIIHQSSASEPGFAEGNFDPVPSNLILLGDP